MKKMATTKNGVLILTKTERKALETIKKHINININYGDAGSFIDEKMNPDNKEIKKAKKGIETVDFILGITEPGNGFV